MAETPSTITVNVDAVQMARSMGAALRATIDTRNAVQEAFLEGLGLIPAAPEPEPTPPPLLYVGAAAFDKAVDAVLAREVDSAGPVRETAEADLRAALDALGVVVGDRRG